MNQGGRESKHTSNPHFLDDNIYLGSSPGTAWWRSNLETKSYRDIKVKSFTLSSNDHIGVAVLQIGLFQLKH